MRLREPILFTLAYGAGLLTGLLHFSATAGGSLVLAAAGWVSGRPLITLLASAILLGNSSGGIARLVEATGCATRLPAAALSLSVRLVEPVDSSGGRISVHPLIGCTGSVLATWPPHHAMDAGFDVTVVARWIPRAGTAGRAAGTLVISRVGPKGGAPSLPARLRSAIARASRTLYGGRAPMVDALIVGRRSGIDRELQDRFAQSGLVHLLSISGFHVGIITAWIFLLCRSLSVERGTALGIGAAASVAYVAFLGWPAPATRAAALAVLLALSRIRQRHVEPNSLLSATCLCVLLVDPWAIVDLGGWLSVAALWGASTFSHWTDCTLGTGMGWRTLGSSVGATLATAPITSAALGAVAVVGIALNFLAIPLAAIAVPGVLASLLMYPVFGVLAESLASGAGLALHLLELLAIAGSAVPGGHAVGPAELKSALPWAAALAVSLGCMGKRNTLAEAARRWSWVVVVLLWGALLYAWSPRPAHTASGLTLHFLDVGQGDGAVLRTPAGRWVVIDAGPRSGYNDAGRRVVVPFLIRSRVRELAALIVSHAHADHLGGVSSVLERFPATLVLEPGERVADPLYYEFLDALAAKGIPWHPARRDERLVLDGVVFTVLHPDPQWHGWGEDVNEDSLVLLIEYGSFQALFAGDAGFPAEAEMRSRARAVDLLKVGHHGSRGSTSDEWLDSLRPRAAVISVGQNKYGHPSPPTLQRLRGHRVDVWRTDRDGVVAVTTDGARMTITSDQRSVTYEVR
ncbi:MAG TPA: DNA internalization-related competence protein ComEC/Rec2 [Gemmatimonadales bacterium]|nr:DNA internalization-related competence protein ComEC/Rec2 [Gemmatimonadales bacterium]